MAPTRRVYLVRHGRPLVDRDTPASTWPLDPAGLAELDALRASGRIPPTVVWYSSPEPKALETARRLAPGEVRVVEDLREHERRGCHWFEDPADFRATVQAAFAAPDRAALPQWEPLAVTRARLLPAVRRILEDHPGADVALAGHGTAWTLVAGELTGRAPDLHAWARLRMPDLWVLDVP